MAVFKTIKLGLTIGSGDLICKFNNGFFQTEDRKKIEFLKRMEKKNVEYIREVKEPAPSLKQ